MPLSEPKLLRIRFLGQPMATLAQAGDPPEYALAFEPAFLETGHDLSPLRLPRESLSDRPTIYRERLSPFPGGLPGLIADSLPDTWGRRMQDLAHPGLTTVLGRLAAVGIRGPGALTFEPALDQAEPAIQANLAHLAEEAARLLHPSTQLTPDRVDRILAHGGSSLGGAQPKITAYLPEGDQLDLREILIGGEPPPGFHPHILKFSPLDDEGGGSVEFAFAQMARHAGIRVAPSCLVHDGRRRHFATSRFDRIRKADGTLARRHVHSLSGMLHQEPSQGGIDYDDFIRLARRLTGATGAEECFRRAVFNLLATNRDDHGRNHAFIYHEATREWALSPAYDLNPNVSTVLIGLAWMKSMAIPSSFSQLTRLAESGGITRARATTIFEQVQAAVGEWPRIAAETGVPPAIAQSWHQDMLAQTSRLRADAANRPKPGGRAARP